MTFTSSQTLPPALSAVDAPSIKGQWQNLFDLPNVGIHAHVLPNGKVLFWGRRLKPGEGDLDVRECTPFLWDPNSTLMENTPQPTLKDGTKVNLFCAGHTFLPDGRLLVVGGHFLDSYGLNQATIYEYLTNTWTPTALMGDGDDFRRWYPTATTLADGSVLVFSGSTTNQTDAPVNDKIQIWNDGNWRSLVNFNAPPLYPRMHLGPDGRVFMSGPLALTQFLDTNNQGNWTQLGERANKGREYASAVMYADSNTLEGGKVMYIGGGNPPTNAVEVIDLNKASPRWESIEPMKFPRRQHNTTLLPDGTVLVTGGTKGNGGPNNGFNDLTPGQTVRIAELWDPITGQWTELAAETVDRCYHSTAVLLPDATVLSAGGGEYRPDNNNPNDPKDTHSNAQIFLPPYLFKGPRPDILGAPDNVSYGETFEVDTSNPEEIGNVSWIRLPSVTHSFDQNQRISFLVSSIQQKKLTVTAPPNARVCPPGHYMMFLLNKAKIPSVAKIIKISTPLGSPVALSLTESLTASVDQSATEISTTLQRNQIITDSDKGTFVEVGLTATCPYGLGACWGGAYEALHQMDDVKFVRPIANAEDSTAYVYLTHEGLPNIEQWPIQFAKTANESYKFRGVEVTLKGNIEQQNGDLFLQGNDSRPAILLTSLDQKDKIQWDRSTCSHKLPKEDERLAYQRLASSIQNTGISPNQVEITGPLKKNETGFELCVRNSRLINLN
jgi:galactose oxidase